MSNCHRYPWLHRPYGGTTYRGGFLLGQNFDSDNIPETLKPWGLNLNGNYIRVAQTAHEEDEIERYTGQVLIVQGDADDVVPLAYAQRAVELYANAKLTIIPGVTHGFEHHIEVIPELYEIFCWNNK